MTRSCAIAVLSALLLSSCASGPPPPQKGTPAFFWAAALETFQASDFLKASEHLEQLTKSQGEFTARALPWEITLDAGLAGAYIELADSYDGGSRANTQNPAPYRKQMNYYRSLANRKVLDIAQAFKRFQATQDAKVPLVFPIPAGSAAELAALAKISKGVNPAPAESVDLERRTLERNILLAQCRVAGVGDNVAKLREMFKAGTVEVPRETFLFAVAGILYDGSQIYTAKKLSQPDRVKLLCDAAADTLKPLPDSKEKKALEKKIQAALKAAKG